MRLKPSPLLSITPDTSVFVKDSFSLIATATPVSSSPIRVFLWSVDNGPFSDTASVGRLGLRFTKAQAGKHVVRCRAVDADTMVSLAESTVVIVRLGVPVVKAMSDTAVFINDSSTLHASGADTNGTVTRYLWSIDKAGFTDTTPTGALRVAWSKQDTGRHEVRVAAVDNDSIMSRTDSFSVQVRLGMPVIKPLRDTALYWGDTVTVAINANDTNGTIVKYLLNSSGSGVWTDSSAAGSFKITSGIHTVKKVIAGVRDDDGLVAADTFAVTFKARPCSLTAGGLPLSDTILVRSADSARFTFPLTLAAKRADGAADTFTYSLWTGTNPAALALGYHGAMAACTLSISDTGTHYWKITAVDGKADTAAGQVASVSVLLERTVCFTGHSVVWGLNGTPGLGGFRKMVIDTLRAATRGARYVKCVGPVATGNLVPARDDSCEAVNGKTCADIFDSLYLYPSIKADLWIYLCGVNEGYQFPTWTWSLGWANYAVETLDTMHARSPNSEIYVLNSLPFPADTAGQFTRRVDSIFKTNQPVFNRMLDSVVTDRNTTWAGAKQGGIRLVDVYAPMAELPDSVCNPDYFSDFLHPNQAGYERVSAQIFKTMRAAASSFLK